MGLVDLFVIFVASILNAFFAEGISWVLIYRTESYKKLKATIDKTTKKLELAKKLAERPSAANQKANKKKIESLEATLNSSNSAMTMSRMKSTFAVGFTLIVLFGLLSSRYDGQIVGKLPFEPFSLARSMSHRNLPGTDYTDCAFVFVYILSSMALRTNVQKLFGQAPRGSGLFGMQQPTSS